MTRPGVAWEGNEAELFEHAMRAVPAIAKHRSVDDVLMTAATYKAYLREAEELGVEPCVAWSVLASAYSVWMQNLFNLYAASTGVPVGSAIEDAIACTAVWAAQRG